MTERTQRIFKESGLLILRSMTVAFLVTASAWLLVQAGCLMQRKPVVAGDDSGALTLLAAEAVITGKGDARLETFAGKQDIGYWDSASQSLSWEATLKVAGEYRVYLTYSRLDPRQAVMSLTSEATRIQADVPGTGGWDQWRTLDMGRITLPEGRQTFKLTVDELPGPGVINFVEVRLKP